MSKIVITFFVDRFLHNQVTYKSLINNSKQIKE